MPLNNPNIVIIQAVSLIHQRVELCFQGRQGVGRVFGGIQALLCECGDWLAQVVGCFGDGDLLDINILK